MDSASAFRRLERCAEAKSIVAGGRMNEELEALEVLDLSKLTHVTGGIELYDFPNLRELRLPALEEIDSPNGVAQFTIYLMPELEVLELGSLRRVSNWETTPAAISVIDAPKVQILDLSQLEFASGIEISGMDELQSLTAPALTDRNTGIRVTGNLSLETLEIGNAGSTGGAGIVGVHVTDNPALARLAIPGELTVEEVELADLPSLTELDLGPSPDFGLYLRVTRTGLPGLSFDDDELSIIEVKENADLLDLSFPSLTRMESHLDIEGNASLSTLDFGSLAEVGSRISIVDNPLLPTCEATAIVDRVAIGPATTTTGNLADTCGP